jgi:hypothetical protein
MRPLVTFPDAEEAMLGYLKPLWQARAEDEFRPVTFGNAFPAKSPAGKATHLQIELDGTPVVEYPAVERATVRFTLWAAPGQQDAAKAAAGITQALVATHPGDQDVAATRLLTGRLKGADPTTRYPFVSFTARISLRPLAL